MEICDISKIGMEEAINIIREAQTSCLLVIDASPTQRDKIKDMDCDVPLRGYAVTIHIKDADDGDPSTVFLPIAPVERQIIRHQDRYYIVKHVIQSTGFGVAIVVDRISIESILPMPALHIASEMTT